MFPNVNRLRGVFQLECKFIQQKKSLNDGKEISELQLSLLIYIDEQWTYCQWIVNGEVSRDMGFTTMWHFDMNRLRRACATTF